MLDLFSSDSEDTLEDLLLKMREERKRNLFGPEKGHIFDKYVLEDFIGCGSEGSAWVVRETQTDEIFILKILSPLFSSSHSGIKAFVRSAEISKSINSGTPRVVETGVHNGILFIAFEYIEGSKSLCDILLSKREVKGMDRVSFFYPILLKLLLALKEVHKKQVVHLDLRPDNVLVTDQSTFLIDFGNSARIYDNIDDVWFKYVNRYYHCPEWVNKDTDLNYSLDIFSFGCILFECLTGYSFFRGYYNNELFEPLSCDNKYPEYNIESLKFYNPHVPDFLEKVCLKCLDKNMDARYNNVEDLLKDFSCDDALFV